MGGRIRRAAVWLLGVLLVLLTGVGLWMSWRARSDDPLLEWTTLAIQLAFAAAAAVLWPDRHQRGNAALLALAGFLDGVSSMSGYAFWQIDPGLNQIGYAFGGLSTPLIVMFLLRFPTPTPSFRHRRVFMILVWAVALETVPRSTLWDWTAVGEPPDAWWTIYPSRTAFDVSMCAATVVGLALCGWFALVQRRRFRAAAGRPAQKVIRLISVLAMVLAAAQALRSLDSTLSELGVASGATQVAGVVDNLLVAGSALAIMVATIFQAVRRSDVIERLLSAAGDPEAVQTALRRELGDPSLTIAFRLDGRWMDPAGRLLPDHTAAQPGRLQLRDGMAADDTVRIEADPMVESDPGRLRLTLAAAGLALENTRLTVERRAHLAELAASRTRLVEAGTEQRRRLERDLHDGAQQSLLGVAATLSRADLATDQQTMRAAVDDARGQLLAAIDELRRLARGIHPSALSQGGLGTALTSLSSRTGRVRLELGRDLADGRRLPAPLETAAYFVVAEAVTNALKHGGDGQISVSACCQLRHLEIVIVSDGTGTAQFVPGGGLSGLLDRVRALGGDLELRSRPGSGSVVSARLPLSGRPDP